MDSHLFIGLFVIIVVMLGILIWLGIVYIKLNQKLLMLVHTIEQNSQDISGLCSAAVSVDRKLSENSAEIHEFTEKITAFTHQKQQNTAPYQNAIEKIRSGAKAEELMELCGLSREEANVLISMHSHDNG